jgi:hypothetical protein
LLHVYAEGETQEVSRELERELEQSVAHLIGQEETAVRS